LLTHPTLDQLNQLGLAGMAQAFVELEASGDATTFSHADWLALLLDREVTHRRDKRLAARLRYARLRQHAAIEDVDYRAPRGLDRALFQRLAEGEWIEAHDNLILCGPTGVGKSWLALRARPQGLPRQPLGPLSAGAQAVRRAGAGARRRPLCSYPAQPDRRAALDPRRLGSRTARRPRGSLNLPRRGQPKANSLFLQLRSRKRLI
jgi:hypothetical protein